MPDRVDERRVATDLEKGSGTSLTQLFAGKFEEDRNKSLHAIEQIYKQDVAAHKTNAQLDFQTNDFWHNEIKVQDNKSGNILFYDQLNLKERKHIERATTIGADGKQVAGAETTESVPSDRVAIDSKQVADVTRALEKGDPTSLAAALAGKMQEERAHFLESVQKQNDEDIKQKRTQISLSITVEGFKHHTNELSVMRYAPGNIFTSNFWNNPAVVYSDQIDMNTGKRDVTMRKDDRS